MPRTRQTPLPPEISPASPRTPAGSKSEETRARILNAALAIFRERGFEKTTMREVAEAASVATGAAYYYFDSKDAIVSAFYQQAQEELAPVLESRLAVCRSMECRLRTILDAKFEYFGPNRKLLGALSAYADPEKPLSPFSRETAPIREADLLFFERVAADSKMKLPKDIQPYLPRLLWLYQMGLLLFWVYDHSPAQRRTTALMNGTLKMLVLTLKLASVPLLRPMHRLAGELLQQVFEDNEQA